MTDNRVLTFGLAALGAAILGIVFALYRSPLLEMSLSGWMPC